MVRVTFILLLSISCNILKRDNSNPIPPDVKPAIEAIQKDTGVKRETREEVIKTLKSCQQYSEEVDERFSRLEAEIGTLRAEISSKDLKIKSLEEELETWKKLKFWSFVVVTVIVVFFFLNLLWKNRTVIMKLAGLPIP